MFLVLSYPTWYLGRVYNSILPYLIPRTCLIWLVITWKDAPTVKELTTVSVRTMERNPSLPIPAISWINPRRKYCNLLKVLSPFIKGKISEKSFCIIFLKIFSLSTFFIFLIKKILFNKKQKLSTVFWQNIYYFFYRMYLSLLP